MRTILLASLKGHMRQYIASAIAIVLGVGFVAAALITIASLRAGIEQAVAKQYGNKVSSTEALAEYTGEVDVFGGMVLGFAGIAMVVAMLVVANTFAITVAGRSRELALFRCVGAGKGQVFRSVLAESMALGLIASTLGLILGISLAHLGMRLLGSYVASYVDLHVTFDEVVLSVSSVAIAIGVGAVTTVLAALVPALRATRVPPLAALHPELTIRARSRAKWATWAEVARLGIGALLAASGAAVMYLGMTTSAGGVRAMALGLGGGVISFLGVLAIAPVLAPAVVWLSGRLVRQFGVPAKVAVNNAMRNPRRTAAAASALLVGVTLVTTLLVGAATGLVTTNRVLDKEYPVDLSITNNGEWDGRRQALEPGELSENVPQALREIDGVEATARLRSGSIAFGTELPKDPAKQIIAFAVDPTDAKAALRNPWPVTGLEPGTIVLGPALADNYGVHTGDRTEFVGERNSKQFTVQVIKAVDTPNVLLTSQDLEELADETLFSGAWVKVAPGSDLSELNTRAEQIADSSGADITGSAITRGAYAQVLEAVVLAATGLLVMSVLIALIGIGNTLSLSVLERTRENALLRALGLTRVQLRTTLGIEALLIAVAAIVLGSGLGIAYGIIGTKTLLAAVDAAVGELVPTIPWVRLGLMAMVVSAAAVLASVLAARRAIRIAPSAALTAE